MIESAPEIRMDAPLLAQEGLDPLRQPFGMTGRRILHGEDDGYRSSGTGVTRFCITRIRWSYRAREPRYTNPWPFQISICWSYPETI